MTVLHVKLELNGATLHTSHRGSNVPTRVPLCGKYHSLTQGRKMAYRTQRISPVSECTYAGGAGVVELSEEQVEELRRHTKSNTFNENL